MKFLLAFGIFFGTLLLCAQAASSKRKLPPGFLSGPPVKKRATVAPNSLVAQLGELADEAVGLKTGWYIKHMDRPGVLKAARQTWLNFGTCVVGLSGGRFARITTVPEIFGAEGTVSDPSALFPTQVKFDTLVNRLLNYVKQANWGVTCPTRSAMGRDLKSLVDYYVAEADVKDTEGRKLLVPAEIWTKILCGATDSAAIAELVAHREGGDTGDISMTGFIEMIEESPPLREAVINAVAPFLLRKHVPRLASKENLSLDQKLLMCPVVLTENRQLRGFLDACKYAEIGTYSSSRSSWFANLLKHVKTIAPFEGTMSSMYFGIDCFLMAAASSFLNNGQLIPEDAEETADVLTGIYNVDIEERAK